MSASIQKCPFQVGEAVIYEPSPKGFYSDVMDPPSQRLVPGQIYIVASVREELYVVVEGYSHPGGGIFWTEFKSAKS